jgi:hypothetical protein
MPGTARASRRASATSSRAKACSRQGCACSISAPGRIAAARSLAGEFLIEAHNPRWRMGRTTGFHPQWASDLSLARFTCLAFARFDHEAACPRAD